MGRLAEGSRPDSLSSRFGLPRIKFYTGADQGGRRFFLGKIRCQAPIFISGGILAYTL